MNILRYQAACIAIIASCVHAPLIQACSMSACNDIVVRVCCYNPTKDKSEWSTSKCPPGRASDRCGVGANCICRTP